MEYQDIMFKKIKFLYYRIDFKIYRFFNKTAVTSIYEPWAPAEKTILAKFGVPTGSPNNGRGDILAPLV